MSKLPAMKFHHGTRGTALRAVVAIAAACLVGACANPPMTTAGGDRAAAPKDVIGGAALPPGAVIKTENSLIIGSGEQWVGRVVADVGKDSEAAYRYFMDTYPAQGWTLITTVRGKTSLMVFTKQDRTATIEMAEGGVLGGAQATLTVAPRNAAVTAPARKP